MFCFLSYSRLLHERCSDSLCSSSHPHHSVSYMVNVLNRWCHNVVYTLSSRWCKGRGSERAFKELVSLKLSSGGIDRLIELNVTTEAPRVIYTHSTSLMTTTPFVIYHRYCRLAQSWPTCRWERLCVSPVSSTLFYAKALTYSLLCPSMWRLVRIHSDDARIESVSDL